MNAEVFTCPWCRRSSAHPIDLKYGFCTCCGDEILGRRECEHRAGRGTMTITELWQQGVRNVRREPWSDGSYLELQPFPLDPTKYHIVALVHSPLEWGDAPDDAAHRPREVSLWQVPPDGWEPYTGPTVEQRSARKDEQDA